MTRRFIIFLSGFLGLLVLTVPCLAKGWNNITPFKTTRAEVIKLLGEPKPFQGRGSEYFDSDGDRVFILWTLPDCFVGKKLGIDEKSAGPDALVYKITVEPKDPSVGKYEDEVRELLAFSGSSDCIGVKFGSCGLFNTNIGFGYSRDDRGIKQLEYLATEDDVNQWLRRIEPCKTASPAIPIASKPS